MGRLFPTRTIFSALGCLMQDPLLLEDSKIKLNRNDFRAEGESIFHLMIFAAINNLLDKGITNVTPKDIDDYLVEYPEKYKMFQDNMGVEWCFEAIEHSDPENYLMYAEKIKKFSLLRELEGSGISLEGIYDVSDDPDEENEYAQAEFDELSIDDILKIVEDRVLEITSAFQIGYDRVSSKAGDGGLELLQSFEEAPMYGLPAMGQLQNTIYRGLLPKTSLLRSATTNLGKTRQSLGEATDIAISKWYNPEKDLWEPHNKKHKVLFISTEMEEDELQPTMWSYISGIPEERIKDGKLTEHEKEVVKEAIKHLQECDLFIEYVPKFDPQTINTIVKEYAIREEVEVVFFDYIHLSFEIMMEIANKTRGMSMREDMMLSIFAAGLEELARQYNFHLRTATQMNGGASQVDSTTQMLDQNLLRGAKAMADKYQYGIIMAQPTEKELQLLEPYTSQGFGELPNIVYHIYKNRKSKWKGKLYLYIDYDTMRVKELFFTNFNSEKLNVPKTDLTEIEEEEEEALF